MPRFLAPPTTGIAALGVLALLGLASRLAAQAPVAPPLVITGATVWTDAGLLSNHELHLANGCVTALGPAASTELVRARPAKARIVDAKGDTVLPGLTDAHVHLVLGARTPKDTPAAEIHAATARQLLRSGVTTGRIHLMSLPQALAARDRASSDAAPSPRLQLGGPALFGGQPTWENPNGNVWGVKSPADAADKVRRLHAAGVQWIAVHELGKFQSGELEALIATARELGLRLTAGGDRNAEVERAVELGFDSVEYLEFTAAPRYPDELVAKMQTRGGALFVVPPIGYNHRYVAYRRGEMALDAPHLVEFLPPAVAAFTLNALREDRTKPNNHATRSDAAFPTLAEKFRQLRAAGVQLVIGTDCGSDANFQSDAIWWEMETWRRLGVPPHEIVRAATTHAAALLQQPDIGHLRVGAPADLLILRGALDDRPLTLDRVRLVAKAGHVFVDEGKWREPTGQNPKSEVGGSK